MSNWKAGDKAVCIRDERWGPIAISHYGDAVPKKDVVYLVTDTKDARFWHGETVLRIAGYDKGWWRSTNFRKLVPLCDRADVGQEVAIPSTVTGFPAGR